ncbi:MAG: IS5 family transposase [Chromatiaceae bacterium]|nr:IS5 family transposase [Chromatiaceae bacterium]MBP6733316.1 IS5 family transposase [Chromatiaceae bacterium]MBP6806810.1 IS5 family transposase [Chromatiaceae bacterium]MBP8282497.1 IS5 family transposase [Chromatiaceae bacterium]MBP8288419.1 IS5 family transposase [Chromatiaceae bacterium]
MRDDQWQRIQALLPGRPSDPGRTAADHRTVVAAVLWMLQSGAPWRDLPTAFGNWNSTDQRFARWERPGIWERLFAISSQDADCQDVYIDSSILGVHQHRAGAEKKTRASSLFLPTLLLYLSAYRRIGVSANGRRSGKKRDSHRCIDLSRSLSMG